MNLDPIPDLAQRKAAARKLLESGDYEPARAAYAELCDQAPGDPEVWHFLGVTYGKLHDLERSAEYLRRAAETGSRSPYTFFNLGWALAHQRDLHGAIVQYRRAIELKPDFARAYAALANARQLLDQTLEATELAEQALRIDPNCADALATLASIRIHWDEPSEGIRLAEKAIAINPKSFLAHAARGSGLIAVGDLERGIESLRATYLLDSENALAGSGILLYLHYQAAQTAQSIASEHRDWARVLKPRPAVPVHQNSPHPDRRIRVGYVSPDFATHSVSYFIRPVLDSHDRQQFEVFCYSDRAQPDEMTSRIKAVADHWHDVTRLGNDELADLIVRDEIDILVDLAGHTVNNRLLVFARKPAPLQVSYLGYPGTTGLTAIDYRITDDITDPEGDERFYSEQLYRLAGGFLCYEPPEFAPPVADPPAVSTGHVTFGTFNHLLKISPEVIRCWSEILRTTPGSRLFLKTGALRYRRVRQQMLAAFAGNGIGAERIDLMGWVARPGDHLELYRRIDVALDTFPYNGATTTCEALWMGVPVVTLAGNRHAARVGKSLLRQVGLPELIADSAERYVAIATQLAADPDRLAQLRRDLRPRMQRSPLCDARSFTQRLEAAYRDIWRRWCAGHAGNQAD